MADLPDVREGDVWACTDPRGGPTVLVQRVCGNEIGCPALTYRRPHAHVVTAATRTRRRSILLSRFRPNRNGYRLVSRGGNPVEAPDE